MYKSENERRASGIAKDLIDETADALIIENLQTEISKLSQSSDVVALQKILNDDRFSKKEKISNTKELLKKTDLDSSLRGIIGIQMGYVDGNRKDVFSHILSPHSKAFQTLLSMAIEEELDVQAELSHQLHLKTASQFDDYLLMDINAKINNYLLQLAEKVVEFRHKSLKSDAYKDAYVAAYHLQTELKTIIFALKENKITVKQANQCWQQSLMNAQTTLVHFRGMLAFINYLLSCILPNYKSESDKLWGKVNATCSDLTTVLESEEKIDLPVHASILADKVSANELHALGYRLLSTAGFDLGQFTVQQLKDLDESIEAFKKSPTPEQVDEVKVAAIEAVKFAKKEITLRRQKSLGQDIQTLDQLEAEILNYELTSSNKR